MILHWLREFTVKNAEDFPICEKKFNLLTVYYKLNLLTVYYKFIICIKVKNNGKSVQRELWLALKSFKHTNKI